MSSRSATATGHNPDEFSQRDLPAENLAIEVYSIITCVDRNRITGGGVTAGIDFGLTIASILYGEETAKIVQLLMEYDPAPPFDVGSPEKAGPELVNKAVSFMQKMSNLDMAKSAS